MGGLLIGFITAVVAFKILFGVPSCRRGKANMCASFSHLCIKVPSYIYQFKIMNFMYMHAQNIELVDLLINIYTYYSYEQSRKGICGPVVYLIS